MSAASRHQMEYEESLMHKQDAAEEMYAALCVAVGFLTVEHPNSKIVEIIAAALAKAEGRCS